MSWAGILPYQRSELKICILLSDLMPNSWSNLCCRKFFGGYIQFNIIYIFNQQFFISLFSQAWLNFLINIYSDHLGSFILLFSCLTRWDCFPLFPENPYVKKIFTSLPVIPVELRLTDREVLNLPRNFIPLSPTFLPLMLWHNYSIWSIEYRYLNYPSQSYFRPWFVMPIHF